jgi:hypothetical protein
MLLLLRKPLPGEPVCHYPKLQEQVEQGKCAEVAHVAALCREALKRLHELHGFFKIMEETECEACKSPRDVALSHVCMLCICPLINVDKQEWRDATDSAPAGTVAAPRKRVRTPSNAASAEGAGGIVDAPGALQRKLQREVALALPIPDMVDSTELWQASRYAELRERMLEDGFLFLRGVLPAADVSAARQVFFEGLLRSACLQNATAEQPTAKAVRRGSELQARAWDARSGTLSINGSRSADAKTVGNSSEMERLYQQHMHELCAKLCSSSSEARFALLPECTWMRALMAGGQTEAHSDVGFFLRQTDRLTNLYRDHSELFDSQLSAAAASDAAPLSCHSHMCQASGEQEKQLHSCACCRKAFHAGCEPSLSNWLADPLLVAPRWHCDACLEAPSLLYTCWMPLLDLTAQSSRLQVLPGSHRLQGYNRMQPISNGDVLPADYHECPAFPRMDWCTAPADMRAGDLILFNWKLIHASNKHNDSCLRLSLDTRCALRLS